MLAPEDLFRRTDADAQIGHRFDGRVEVVIGAVGQALFFVVKLRDHLLELTANPFQ